MFCHWGRNSSAARRQFIIDEVVFSSWVQTKKEIHIRQGLIFSKAWLISCKKERGKEIGEGCNQIGREWGWGKGRNHQR